MQATPIDARTIEVVEQFSEVPLANNAYNKGLEHYERGLYLANVNAIALFEKAIEYDPSFGMAYIRLSESLAQESNRWGGGRLDEALDAATTAVSLEPTNARSHNALGIAQLLGNDTDSALESFQRSNELDPTYWDSTYNAAYTHMARFEHAESIELFLRVLEYSPEHFEAMSRLGFQYLRMGNTDDARYWLDRTLVHAPQSMLAWTGLAMLELVTRNTSKTIENCEHVIRVMPNNETCLHVTAVAHLIEGNTEEAHRIFDYVIENIERTDYAELGQAQILLSKGNTDEGVKVVNKVLERTLLKLPESEGQWRESRIIAACYTLLGDKTSAVSWLEKSSESGRRFPLWDATDPMFANLHGDHRFNRFIALAKNAD